MSKDVSITNASGRKPKRIPYDSYSPDEKVTKALLNKTWNEMTHYERLLMNLDNVPWFEEIGEDEHVRILGRFRHSTKAHRLQRVLEGSPWHFKVDGARIIVGENGKEGIKREKYFELDLVRNMYGTHFNLAKEELEEYDEEGDMDDAVGRFGDFIEIMNEDRWQNTGIQFLVIREEE